MPALRHSSGAAFGGLLHHSCSFRRLPIKPLALELRRHEAANQVYQFAWKELADVYLEASKEQLTDEKLKHSTEHMLVWCLVTSLKLVHPFAPFVTEELWGRLFGTTPSSVLMVQSWPTTTP